MGDKVPTPKMAVLQDSSIVDWLEAVRREALPNEDYSVGSNRSDGRRAVPQMVANSMNHSGAMTTMTKLSECMVKHQEALTRTQEERKYPRMKA